MAVVTASSALATHSRALERRALADADILLLGGISAAPAQQPGRNLDELIKTAVATLQANGAQRITKQT